MAPPLIYLSRAAVDAIGLPPADIIEAVEAAFAAQAAGAAKPGPKAVVPVTIGHSFHAMPGLLGGDGLAGMKFFGVVPDNPARGLPNVCSLVVLSDVATALPVAIMEGGWITAMRTAAMTAFAARRLADPASATAAFVGCGVQAHSHALLLRAVLPSLRKAVILGRSPARRDVFAAALRDAGWEVRLASGPEDILQDADIAVTTASESPEGAPVLNPALLAPRAFVAAVDLGRSWPPPGYGEFAVIATDDIAQSRSLVAEGRLKAPPHFDVDLASLASGAFTGAAATGRTLFVFSGHVLGDLAVAAALYRRAAERGIGLELPR